MNVPVISSLRTRRVRVPSAPQKATFGWLFHLLSKCIILISFILYPLIFITKDIPLIPKIGYLNTIPGNPDTPKEKDTGI